MNCELRITDSGLQSKAPSSAPSARVEKRGRLSDKEEKRLKDACRDFEALFLSIVLKQMRKTVPKSELFGSDPAQDTFQEMMDDEIGRSAAKTSSMGIADMLYRQLTNQMSK